MASSTFAETELRGAEPSRQIEEACREPALQAGAGLRVDRTDIDFFNRQRQRVRIQVTVHNASDAWSRPTGMRLQAAPLGAFLPWKELGEVRVPVMAPHGSVQVEMDALAKRSRPLGDFSNVPPRQLLVALAGDDDDREQRERAAARRQRERAERAPRPGSAMAEVLAELFARDLQQLDEPVLPDDPLQLIGSQSSHWAGNINVLIGRHATERHMAQALRIYPGLSNLAIFAVGDRPDDYKFEFSGAGGAWKAALYKTMQVPAILQGRRPELLLPTGQWTFLQPYSFLLLAICPPRDCEAGTLNVHVRQRSTDREAIVEFSLDPNAAGPGCYAF